MELSSYGIPARISSGTNLSNASSERSPDTTTLVNDSGPPELVILEEPQNSLTFRYLSTIGKGRKISNQSIFGENSQKNAITFPKVQIVNFNNLEEDLIIRCTLYTVDENNRIPHVHKLVRKSSKYIKGCPTDLESDPIDVPVRSPDFTAEFKDLTVFFTEGRSRTEELLRKMRTVEKVRKYKSFHCKLPIEEVLKERAERQLKEMNLHAVCLKFEALVKRSSGKYDEICWPTYSRPITNHIRAGNSLVISHLSKISGSCKGNDDVWLMVDKVDENDIKVMFYKEEENWVMEAEIVQIHRQCAILIRTPAYKDQNIIQNLSVKVVLERPSDNCKSEGLAFQYEPERERPSKRPKLDEVPSRNIPESSDYSFSGSINSPVPLTASMPADTFPLVTSTNGQYLTESECFDVVLSDPLLNNNIVVDQELLARFERNISEDSHQQALPELDLETLSDFLPGVSPEREETVIGAQTECYNPVLQHSEEHRSAHVDPTNEMIHKVYNGLESSGILRDYCELDSPLERISYLVHTEVGRNAGNHFLDLLQPIIELLYPMRIGWRYFVVCLYVITQTCISSTLDFFSNSNMGSKKKDKKKLLMKHIEIAVNDQLQEYLLPLMSFSVGNKGDSFLHTLAGSKSPIPTKVATLVKGLNHLQNWTAVINKKNEMGESPLLIAAARGSAEMVALLLEAGADVDAVDRNGNTACHLSITRVDGVKVLRFLLEFASPDLASTNKSGYTVLHLAVIFRKMEIVSCLGESLRNRDELEMQYVFSQKDRKHGNTALHFAIYRGFTDVQLLLKYLKPKDCKKPNFRKIRPIDLLKGRTDESSKAIQRLLKEVDVTLKSD